MPFIPILVGMCIAAGILMWTITVGWERPFPYREGDIPERAIAARVAFDTVNSEETQRARETARRQVVTIYRHDREQVKQVRLQLIDKVRQIHQAWNLIPSSF